MNVILDNLQLIMSVIIAVIIIAIITISIAYFCKPKALDDMFDRVSSNIVPHNPGIGRPAAYIVVPIYMVEPKTQYDGLSPERIIRSLEEFGYTLASYKELVEAGNKKFWQESYWQKNYSEVVFKREEFDDDEELGADSVHVFSFVPINHHMTFLSRPLYAVVKLPAASERMAA